MDRNRLPCRICGSPPEFFRDRVCMGHGEYIRRSVYRCGLCGISVEVDELEFPAGSQLDSAVAQRWDTLMQ